MKLSICIINYNSGSLLEGCLASIQKYSAKFPYEVIVVDNNSSDGSQLSVKRHKDICFIQNTDNLGFASANNQAFMRARGEYMFMLNVDTEVKLDSLNEMIKCADMHPEAGLVSAKLVNPDGTHQIGFNVRRFPGYGSELAQLLLLDEIWPNNPLTSHYLWYDFDYERLQPVEQPAASALLYRRTTWAEVGGFDERFTNWYNDVDLCNRVWKAGWSILYCPTAEILHYGGMGVISRTTTSVMVEIYRSKRLYFHKYFGFSGYLLISSLILVGMIFRVASLLLFSGLNQRVNTKARNAQSSFAVKSAFRAVFFDTIATLRNLPNNSKLV
jgi:GT2 family glycosyltransferase